MSKLPVFPVLVPRRMLLAGGAALALAPLPALATADVGRAAPLFTALDSNGKTHSLESYRGKIVVLETTNHDCPYVAKHYLQDAAGYDISAVVHIEAQWDPSDPLGETRWLDGLASSGESQRQSLFHGRCGFGECGGFDRALLRAERRQKQREASEGSDDINGRLHVAENDGGGKGEGRRLLAALRV